ncbi:MAG: S9 family peptidase [Anaerolineales bacterium]|nr:S9 family peptidase [Anaerolineales bacterium]
MVKVPLIPRRLFFENPDKELVRISPDGARIAFLAPLDGVLNVWVAPLENLDDARPVTHDMTSGIHEYHWAQTNDHILYLQDEGGNENWRLYCVDLTTNDSLNLTPFDGVKAQIIKISHKFPQEIVIGLNHRVPEFHDIFRVDIFSGSMTLMEQNDRFLDVFVDDKFRVRLATQVMPDGSAQILARMEKGDWEIWQSTPAEDTMTTSIEGFDEAGRVIIRDSRGRNTSAVVIYDQDGDKFATLAENRLADVQQVLCHPTQKYVQAVSFVYQRKSWQIIDTDVKSDFVYLGALADGELEIASRSLDDQLWIVQYIVDDGPACFYLYNRDRRQAEFLFTDRQELEDLPLVKMHSVVIKARDGLDLVCYYSLPAGSESEGRGIPDQPVPLVLYPHGGPWSRNYWGYNGRHQWLANRGYAVMAVNFRSSTGFGKAFVNAGNCEWGGKIIQDQVDAVQWAISRGIADPDRLAIMGSSFGGYSALAGLTFFPEFYACGVDIVGPSNIITLLETAPPYWKPMIEMFISRMGDYRTPEGRALLAEHSPLTHVDRIRRPLLIGQGANDPRVNQAESDRIVRALKSRNIPVTYVLYPDEGHGFDRPENNLSFLAIGEAFLAGCLGGRFEPIGSDFENSSLQVLEGADHVSGLAEALKSRS